MSLKLLAIPLMIIGIMVISIGYIKPSILLAFEKKSETERVTAQVTSLGTIVSNVRSMKAQIASAKSDSESDLTDAEFLRQRYFPASSDIERGIDQLNFLATQSGLIVGEVEVEDVKKMDINPNIPVEGGEASGGLFTPTVDPSAVITAPVRRTYTPSAYTVTVNAVGSYESAKGFYDRLMHAQRFFTIEQATIETHLDATGVITEKSLGTRGDLLDSKITVSFPLLPPVSISSAFGDIAFTKAKLDFGEIAMIRQDKQGTTSLLPPASPLGKTNPFK